MSKTLGEIAYDAYCAHRNWRSFNGDPLPSFAETRVKNPDIAKAWEIAGEAVAKQIAIETGRG